MIYDINYSCEEIANAIGGELKGKNVNINGISINSKEKSEEPFCFFAIKGKNFDGADYIDEAIKNGAGLIVTDKNLDCSVPVISVEDTKKALGLLGKKHKGSTKIIGVTGSVGKTTVKDMIISVLKEKYSVTGTKDNNNNEIGVALTLLSIKNEEFCVVEMGMRAMGEIEWLSFLCEPETAVITNAGSAHIGILGSYEKIFKAKTEILKFTQKSAVLPSEERFKQLEQSVIKGLYVGENGDYEAKAIEQRGQKIYFEINKTPFEIDSIYEHNVINASFAYAVGKQYGIDDNAIRRGLNNWRVSGSRGETFFHKGVEVISDCYNANYESTRAAIESMVEYSKKNKKTAVLLGDMLELGANAKELHFKIGRLCRELSIDKAFFYGEYSEQYRVGYGVGTIIEKFDSIANEVFSTLEDNYVLLIKASNSVNFERIIENLREIR